MDNDFLNYQLSIVLYPLDPKVSVLVPTYKPNARFLREAMDSLLRQSEQDFACVICDEPTEVNTRAILTPYLSDPRFEFHPNETCLGIGGNWNRAQGFADAPIIAYLFQDDLWGPNYLKSGLTIFEKNPSVGFVSLGHDYFATGDVPTMPLYESLKTFVKENITPGLHRGSEMLRWWIQHELSPNIIGEPPFTIIRSEVMSEVGPWNEKLPQFLDVEYWLRCLMVTDWYYLPENLGSFRVHAAGASAQNEASGAGIFDRLQCFEMLISKLEGDLKTAAIDARSRALVTMAKKYLKRKEEGKGIGGANKGKILRFCLRHPLLVGTSLVRAMGGEEEKT